MLQDNPDGVPEEDLNEIMKALKKDRVGFLKQFHENFYNYKKNEVGTSEAQLQFDWSIAAYASPRATIKCAESWATTDFRTEMKNIKVPALIVYGDADRIVPIETLKSSCKRD